MLNQVVSKLLTRPERRAALVRYEPPEGYSPGGTECDSGAEMFYPPVR